MCLLFYFILLFYPVSFTAHIVRVLIWVCIVYTYCSANSVIFFANALVSSCVMLIPMR